MTNAGTEIPINGIHFGLISPYGEQCPDLAGNGIIWGSWALGMVALGPSKPCREKPQAQICFCLGSKEAWRWGYSASHDYEKLRKLLSCFLFWCLHVPLHLDGQIMSGRVVTTDKKLFFFLAPRYTRTLVVSFSSSELCLENSLGVQSTEESEHPAGSSLIPFSRESTALMGVVYQDRVPNTTCTQEINCLAVGCLYGVIGMFLHLKLPEGLYKYSAHKYNYSRALARNSHILWDIAVSSPYQSQCKIQ